MISRSAPTMGIRIVNGLISDCLHAMRLYRRTPGASLIALSVLAVGVAFVVAFLSLYVDLIVRPHPGFEASARLATVGRTGGTQLFGIPFPIVQRMTSEMNSVEAVAASHPSNVFIGIDRQEVGIEMVSDQFFEGLRPRLAIGRGFDAEEHALDAEPVAVISYRLWQSRYGGRSDVLGTTVEVTRDPRVEYTKSEPFDSGGRSGFMIGPGEPDQETTFFRIIGVMSESLKGLTQSETALWVPIERSFALFVGSDRLLYSLSAPRSYVRKRPGVSTAAVLSEIESRYADEDLMSISPLRLDAIDDLVSDIEVQRDADRQLRMFLAGSILLAFAAAANVSLFLLARAPGRRRELAIRMAAGAPQRRLARQLASEAGLLVVVAAVLGFLLSIWLNAFLASLALLRDAEWRDVTLLDWRVLSSTAIFLLVLTLLVSLAPMLGLKRFGIADSSRHVSSRASLPQHIAGAAQFAAAGALGAAAIAFGWHLASLMYSDPGYELTDRYVARFDVPQGGIRGSDNSLVTTMRVREVIGTIPGVTAVAFGSTVPGEEQGLYITRIPDPSNTDEEIDARWGFIDGRFVETLGLNLIYGRSPEDTERDVVLVNQTLARTWWGREDVVGEVLPFDVPYTRQGSQIIGVLEDLSFGHPSAIPFPRTFTTTSYFGPQFSAVLIEASLTSAVLRQQLDQLVSDGAIEAPVSDVIPLRLLREDLIAPDRARGFLTIATATLVVLLSAFGFYGTQRYLVAAGRREYAIRASLGAGPRALGRLVIFRGVLLGLPGLVVGCFLAFIVVAWLRDDFVAPAVSPTIVTTWLLIGLTALLFAASLPSAREAKRTQPAPLLRED